MQFCFTRAYIRFNKIKESCIDFVSIRGYMTSNKIKEMCTVFSLLFAIYLFRILPLANHNASMNCFLYLTTCQFNI